MGSATGDRKGSTYGVTGGQCVRVVGDAKRPPFCIKLREKSEVFDDLHDLGADALLSLHGGGADMSGRLENVPVAHF